MSVPLRLTNPHAVLAALEMRPKDVLEVRLPREGAGDAWQKLAGKAAKAGIPVTARRDDDEAAGRRGDGGRPRAPRGPDRRGGPARRDVRGTEAPPKEGRTGGGLALVREREGLDVHELFPKGAARAPGHGLWLALDCIQDPRNVGAVFRSAAFFGVRGVLLSSDRSAPLTAVSYDTASGGLEYVPFAWASNLRRDLDVAREAGLWILGADEDGERDVTAVDRARDWMLVVGNEEKGLRRLTREACDEICRLTPKGKVRSLNVSVAAAVLMATLRSA
ncbi:MAG: RNA methyltransferase [Planctomycetes bacterium]|nr:RNA methyltransferase [Planctomycetota bacterium]